MAEEEHKADHDKNIGELMDDVDRIFEDTFKRDEEKKVMK